MQSDYADITFFKGVRGTPGQHITHLDLSLGAANAIAVTQVCAHLSSARHLRKLHVRSGLRYSGSFAQREQARVGLGALVVHFFRDEAVVWKRLEHFSMTGLPCPVDSLVHFVELHAATVMTLSFTSCTFTVGHLDALLSLALPSLRYIKACDQHPHIAVPGKHLFSSGNGQSTERALKKFRARCATHDHSPENVISSVPRQLHRPECSYCSVSDHAEYGSQECSSGDILKEMSSGAKRYNIVSSWAIPHSRGHLVEVKDYFSSFRFSKARYSKRENQGRERPAVLQE
ncbi:hypothetical protein Micbo1qcDRAFT_208273 [Microdochium bolleyi]|uniref:Uncharacterized protein n=1 Tax=Microdochium bolleyi TaxID=196109 RepID=A0A136IQQ0_9PEZI|nr:hypothetical protein Micbo1qcDRAFT_208273 [Microdochium bolleyi]